MKLTFIFLLTGFFLIQYVNSQFLPIPKPKDVVTTLAKPVVNTVKLFTQQFLEFKNRFGKKYSSPEEEKKRLSIFSVNHGKILDLQKITLPFVVKINEFCDLVSSEFNKLLNGLKVKTAKKKRETKPTSTNAKSDHVDWNEKGKVTPVKNQGECASCYAFASAAAVESHRAIKTGKLEDISPQEVLDCSLEEPYDNYGCEGGSLEPAYDYIKDKGLVHLTSYPYLAETGEECKATKTDLAANIKGYVVIEPGDEDALIEALNTKGPVAVGIDASSETWQFYGGGIYYEPECKSSIENLNHAVLLVGYGEENGQKYWTVKNSYGESWGDNGYAKISRNVTNHCGIATYPVYPEI